MSDSDLDDELLYVAGRKRTAPKKRGRQASDSDSDYGHDAHAVHKEQKGPSKRSKKPAADHAPHVEPADDDADPMATLPPEEQARLNAMTELEREQALFELVEARDRERDRQRLHQREEQRVEVRASSRRARGPTHAEGAIGKLAAARQKQEVRAQRRERESAKDSGRGKGKAARELDEDEQLFEFDDDEEDLGGGSEEEGDDDEEEGGAEGEEDMELSEDDQELQEVVLSDEGEEGRLGLGEGGDKEDDEAAYAADYRDVGTIILKRTRLERWHDEPFFADAVTGCMVRIAVGTYRDGRGADVPNYQLMRITEVVTRNSYKFAAGRTDKWLRLEDSGVTKAMQMATISNGEPAEEEFERYKRHCEAAGVPLITKGDVAAITNQIEAARNYRYKPEDIKRRVDQRRAKGVVVGGWAAERSRLERELERAVQEGDEDKADVLRRDMEELSRKMEARYAPAGAARALADVNTRNRAANSSKALKGTSNRVGGLGGGLGGEEGGADDVFSRRHTASKVYWNTARGGGGGAGGEQLPAPGADAAAAAAAKAASVALQLRRTSSNASDTKKVKAHQVNMDPMQLVKELPMDIDLTRLRQTKGLVRRLLGPRWQLPDCSHEITGREVLTLSEWKQRMNTATMMEG